jgi:hypothetical protein
MTKVRAFLSHKLLIHGLVLLGLLALWGYIETGSGYILLGVAASFAGAVCGAFIRVIDAIRKRGN